MHFTKAELEIISSALEVYIEEYGWSSYWERV